MRKQNLVRSVGLFAVIVMLATLPPSRLPASASPRSSPGSASGAGNGSPYMEGVSAQSPNPRYGRWKLKSDAAPPTSNIMTYEPFGSTGMKITIDAVNRDGVKSQWWYTTMFNGKDETLTGNPASDTGSVRIITDRINEIVYKKGGKVTQVLTNVLSPDGSTIGIIYMRMDPDGRTSGVTFATYERMK